MSDEIAESSHNTKTKTRSRTRTRSRSKQPKIPNDSKFDAMKREAAFDRKNRKNDTSRDLDEKPGSHQGAFDKTQWENSQWPDHGKVTEPVVPPAAVNASQTAPLTPSKVQSTPIVGENLQNTVEHGEYLLDFPILSISIDFAELAITIIGIGLALAGTQAVIDASYMLIVNAIILLLLLIAIIVIQWRAIHVREEKDLNENVRFYVGSAARRYIVLIHLLRLTLVCSMIAILIYYVFCGDGELKFRATSICQKNDASRALFGVSAMLFGIQFVLIIAHLVFYCRNRLAVRSCCQ